MVKKIWKAVLILFLLCQGPSLVQAGSIREENRKVEIPVRGTYEYAVPGADKALLMAGETLLLKDGAALKIEEVPESERDLTVRAALAAGEGQEWLQAQTAEMGEYQTGFYLEFFREDQRVSLEEKICLSMELPPGAAEPVLLYVDARGNIRELSYTLEEGRICFYAEKAGYYVLLEQKGRENGETVKAVKTGDPGRVLPYVLSAAGAGAILGKERKRKYKR